MPLVCKLIQEGHKQKLKIQGSASDITTPVGHVQIQSGKLTLTIPFTRENEDTIMMITDEHEIAMLLRQLPKAKVSLIIPMALCLM